MKKQVVGLSFINIHQSNFHGSDKRVVRTVQGGCLPTSGGALVTNSVPKTSCVICVFLYRGAGVQGMETY